MYWHEEKSPIGLGELRRALCVKRSYSANTIKGFIWSNEKVSHKMYVCVESTMGHPEQK